MPELRERHLVGADSLETAAQLLQRVRRAHPTKGLYEAADLQWWWRTPRSTDDLPQLFWFDEGGRPEAAAISVDWGVGDSAVHGEIMIALLLMPDAPTSMVERVVERGLANLAACGIEAVDVEVDRGDDVLRAVVADHGFAVKEDGVVETWLEADWRPEIDSLDDGYRLSHRSAERQRPHHMTNPARNHADVETRLAQTTLYRPDLDLVVYDRDDSVASYGLFWFDPTTATGLVEPMRTEDDHQRRGLARHVLTTGVDLLARAGAERIKICFEPANAAARHLYLSTGFEPVKHTDVYAGRTDGSVPG